jgi:hypothetical protein
MHVFRQFIIISLKYLARYAMLKLMSTFFVAKWLLLAVFRIFCFNLLAVFRIIGLKLLAVFRHTLYI